MVTLNLASSAMVYTIWCILAEDTKPFPITIDETQTVAELKKAIKAETNPRLNTVAAHELALYRVRIKFSDKDKCVNAWKVIVQNPSNNPELNSWDELSGVFENSTPPKEVNILVKAPQRESIIDSSSCSIVTHGRRAAGCLSQRPTSLVLWNKLSLR